MTISDADFKAWLGTSVPQYRNILVEPTVFNGSSEVTLKLSQKTFGNYIVAVKGGFSFSQNINLPTLPSNDGVTPASSFSFSIGDVELLNNDGKYDYVFNYVWKNRACLILLGDVRWPRSDYRVILNAIVNDIVPKERDVIGIVLQDKMQRLNAPLTELKLGGETANKDAIIPFVLGEVCNMAPLLSNPLTLEYQVHPAAIEDIIEARDNEAIISITKNLANGKFNCDVAPRGTLTCSVQGHKYAGTYSNQIGTLIQWVATQAGKASTRFDISEIDTANIAAFNAKYPHAVGYTNNANDNMLTCIQTLAGTVGATAVVSMAGLLKLVDLTIGTSVQTIREADIVPRSLKPIQRLPIAGSVKLGYCKNWTPQSKDKALQIPLKHKDLFEKPFRTLSVKDGPTLDKYKLTVTPVEEDTYLLNAPAAITEASRRLSFRKVGKTVYSFTGYSSCFLLELGQTITLINSRYDLTLGKKGVIVGLSFDWFQFQVTVSVLIDDTVPASIPIIATEDGYTITKEDTTYLLPEG